jgi:translation initiation factor IF-1
MVDDPIIVTGGSVTVNVSDKFKDNGHAGGRKKYKNPNGRLVSIKVNGETVRELEPGDTVEIVCDDGA